MSGIQDQVLSAIGEGCTDSASVCETTGLEPNQVHQAVFILKKAGKITKGADGYAIADGVDVAQVAERIAAEVVSKAAAEPKKARKKRAAPPPETKPRRRPKKRVKAATAKPANGHAGNGVASAVEFARFGDFVVLKRPDVIELLRTMQRWQQMVEAVLA